ncbi:MAG: hypothetical protein ABI772_12405 [Bacteroidota bacterium]
MYLLILFGLFNVLNFTYSTSVLKLGFIKLQPLTLLIAVMYYFLNRNKFKARNLTADNFSDSIVFIDAEKIEKFKEKYKFMDDEELGKLKSDPRYVSEAKMAASQLLDERSK